MAAVSGSVSLIQCIAANTSILPAIIKDGAAYVSLSLADMRHI